MKMKRTIVSVALAATVMTSMTGCGGGTEAAKSEADYTATMQAQVEAAIGKPQLTNWFEYSQLKEIYEMRDNPQLICYWYTKNDYTGKWIYQGKCVGYGIPYGASITANERPDYYSYEDNAVLKQAEPNGLYTDSVVTTATWILSVDEQGNITPTYVESEISISQTKIDASRCEDWSLPVDYVKLSDEAEIKGDVKVEEVEVPEPTPTEEAE